MYNAVAGYVATLCVDTILLDSYMWLFLNVYAYTDVKCPKSLASYLIMHNYIIFMDIILHS